MSIINKIAYFKGIGLFELLIVFYPILFGYNYGPIKMNLAILLILDVMSIFRKKCIKFNFKPFIFMYALFLLHEFIYLPILGLPTVRINNDISIIIFLTSILLIVPVIDYPKLEKALMLAAIVSMLGMLYTFFEMFATGSTSPIPIPFMPAPEQGSRLYAEVNRPTSFYWEPASYIGFMLIPSFILLYKRKLLPFFLCILSIFLSTSTTGIITSLIMIVVYVFTQKSTKLFKFLTIAVGVAAVFLLLNSAYFEGGLDKIESTDVERNARLMNGVILISNVNLSDLILGLPYVNLDSYAQHNSAGFFIGGHDVAFFSTFWLLLGTYGIIFLLSYLYVYHCIYKHNKSILPYYVIIIITMFSDPTGLGAFYVFQFLCLIPFTNYYKQYQNEFVS